MELEALAKLVESVKVMTVRPEDLIVLKVEQHLVQESRDRIRKHAQDAFGCARVVILDGGMDIEVLRREAA